MDPYLPRHGDGPHSQVSTRYSSQHLRTVDIRLEDLNSEDISGLVDEGRFGETHTVKLRSEAWNNSALTLGIDYAQVFSTPSLQPKHT